METIFMNTENSKTNEPHKFVFNLLQRLDLSLPYTWENMRKQYKTTN